MDCWKYFFYLTRYTDMAGKEKPRPPYLVLMALTK